MFTQRYRESSVEDCLKTSIQKFLVFRCFDEITQIKTAVA